MLAEECGVAPCNGGERRIDAVLFDCDGVLVDSERVAVECIVEFAARYGARYEFEEALERFTGARMADNLRDIEARGKCKLPDDFEDSLRSHMATEFQTRLEPMDGAAALVESLDLPYCVVSNGPRSKMEITLRIAGLLEHFTGRIVSAYEVGVWKPAPGLFLHAAQMLGTPPERCAVVEDSDYGITAGVAAGMQVFALVPEDRACSMPDGVVAVASLAELREPFRMRATSMLSDAQRRCGRPPC